MTQRGTWAAWVFFLVVCLFCCFASSNEKSSISDKTSPLTALLWHYYQQHSTLVGIRRMNVMVHCCCLCSPVLWDPLYFILSKQNEIYIYIYTSSVRNPKHPKTCFHTGTEPSNGSVRSGLRPTQNQLWFGSNELKSSRKEDTVVAESSSEWKSVACVSAELWMSDVWAAAEGTAAERMGLFWQLEAVVGGSRGEGRCSEMLTMHAVV